MGIDEGVNKAMDFVEHKRDFPGYESGILTGIAALDRKYNGLERGTYTVISGMINGGKTTLMFNVGFNMAKATNNVLYISLEKKATLFFRRILCLHAGVDYNRIKRGGKRPEGISDFWYEKLKTAAKDLNENIKPRYTCLQYVIKTKLSKILSDVDKIRAKGKVDVLIVDYLQAIGTETNHPTRPDLDLADIHQRLMAYGKQHNLVVITALQLKNQSAKEIRGKTKKVTSEVDVQKVEVNPEDYAGSQQIIADADNAWGVVLNADHPSTKMFVNSSKARDDESRTSVVLDFDGKIGRVSDPDVAGGHVLSVDNLIYSSESTEDKINKLEKDDDLFTDDPEQAETTTTTTTEEKPDLDLSDEKPEEKPEEKKEEKKEEIKSNQVQPSPSKALDGIEVEQEKTDDDPEGLFKI